MASEMQEQIARAIWNIRREEEDRCDMELEDMGRRHSVWAEALAVMKAMLEPTTDMEVAGTESWLCEAAVEDRAGANWRAMLSHEIAAAEEPHNDHD